MANNFFNNLRILKPGKLARSDEVENKFDSIGVGFDGVQVETNRAIKLPDGSREITASGATRANQVIGFDASGNLQLQPGVGRYRGNWATATAYVLRDVVKDATSKNLYICQIAHTSGVLNNDIAAGKFVLLVNVVDVENARIAAEAARDAAKVSETNADTSEANAANSASAAATSETNAATSATNAANSASAAATSETNAANSASSAATSATNASASASNAATSETNAAGSETKAYKWAEEAENIEVETGKYSSKHHALKSAASASAAATSETNAANSAAAAATSETNAAGSASSAATSRDQAGVYEAGALTHRDKAYQWSETPVDTEVEPGEYSARHWAKKAEQVSAGNIIQDTLIDPNYTWSSEKLNTDIGGKAPVETTVDQALTGITNTGPLTSILSWLAGLIKGITGKSDWKTAPATTLEAAATHQAAASPHAGHVNITEEYSASIGSAGWVTIAAISSGRTFGEFLVYDTDGSKHNFARINAIASYGQNTVVALVGDRYSTRTIAHARILYNTADRVYGGAKLQVYIESTCTLRCRQILDQVAGWDGWAIQTPVLEGTPSGWAEDTTSRANDITSDGLSAYSLRAGTVNAGTMTASDLVTLNRSNGALQLTSSVPQINFTDTDITGAGRNYWFHHNSGTFYLLQDRSGNGSWDSPYPWHCNSAGTINFGFTPTVGGSNAIYYRGSPANLQNNSWTDGLRLQTPSGYIDFGPANTSYAHIYTDRGQFYLNRDILINGSKVWHQGNDGAGSGLDADLLDGYGTQPNASSANTVAVRNVSGDIHARLLRSSYPADNGVTGNYILTQNAAGSDGADNYARPTSKTWMGANGTWVAQGGLKTGTASISVSINAGATYLVTLNNYSFFPNISASYLVKVVGYGGGGTSPSVGRFGLHNTYSSALAADVNYRYIML